MQLISSLVTAAALLGASAQAQSDDNLVLGLQALRSGSPLHFGIINAAYGKFWVWGPGPETFCPSVVQDCPKGNSTLIDLQVDKGVAGLYSIVPGGQDVYVAPDGSLSFTEPHVEGLYPPGSLISGFTYTPPSEPGRAAILGFNGNGGNGFIACPSDGPYPWQVYVDLPTANYTSDCLGFAVNAINVTGSSQVYEYI